MRKQLIVSLRPDGTIDAETMGMYGDECLSYVSVLEDLLDATATRSAFTADYSTMAAQQHDASHVSEWE